MLSHSPHRISIKIMLWELLTPNIQRIKSIRAIGAVLQQILLRFRILLCRFVFSETVSFTFHASRLHRKNKVIIILAVEVRMRRCLPENPWLISKYFSLCRIGLPKYTSFTAQPLRSNSCTTTR